MANLRIYEVEREYIDYLRAFDNVVREEKDYPDAKSRKYIGVLTEINSCKYFAPLASPKKKFEGMKNGKDFIKIEGGKYGAINLNNMIPVHPDALVDYDIYTEPDKKYQSILKNQVRFIRKNAEEITKTANVLYEIMTGTDEKYARDRERMQDRCCKYKLLEEVSTLYTKKQPSEVLYSN